MVQKRWSENLILGMEPKFHADWSKNRRDRGPGTYCIYNILFFSRFLDVTNASSVPRLIRNLILMILFFFRTFVSCVETEKSVKIDLI